MLGRYEYSVLRTRSGVRQPNACENGMRPYASRTKNARVKRKRESIETINGGKRETKEKKKKKKKKRGIGRRVYA